MKKFLISTAWGVLALMSFSLTMASCNSDGDEPPPPPLKRPTVFILDYAVRDHDSRTSMDEYGVFQLKSDDKIWIYDHEKNVYLASDSTVFNEYGKTMIFYFYDQLDADTYSVFYTGKDSESATSVTVTSTQMQKEWNYADHIGVSGDCVVATAKKMEYTRLSLPPFHNEYKISTMQHQASYIQFMPLLDEGVTDSYCLKKIDIEAVNGSPIAGTYAFSSDGLSEKPTSGGTNKITLKLGDDGLEMDQNNVYTQATNFCLAILPPGEHELKFTYHVVNTTSGNSYKVERITAMREYKANYLICFRHSMDKP